MKRKTSFEIMLIALSVSMSIISSDSWIAHAPALATLYIDPPSIVDLTLTLGDAFTIDVMVSDATFLYAWQANISFDPDILAFANVTEGDYLAGQPEGTYGSQIVGVRSVAFGWSTTGYYVGVSGNGTLAALEFEVLAEGESILKFETEPYYNEETDTWVSPTFMTAQISPNPPPDFDDLDFTAEDGYFSSVPTGAPLGFFAYSPSVPVVGEPVIFDATASFDSDGVIVGYFWDFGDGTTSAGMVVSHVYTTAGSYAVTLTVIDNDGLTDTSTQPITIAS